MGNFIDFIFGSICCSMLPPIYDTYADIKDQVKKLKNFLYLLDFPIFSEYNCSDNCSPHSQTTHTNLLVLLTLIQPSTSAKCSLLQVSPTQLCPSITTPGKCCHPRANIHLLPCEMPGQVTQKLESRLSEGEISTTSDMQMILL